jgi:hypothetical protein
VLPPRFALVVAWQETLVHPVETAVVRGHGPGESSS